MHFAGANILVFGGRVSCGFSEETGGAGSMLLELISTVSIDMEPKK